MERKHWRQPHWWCAVGFKADQWPQNSAKPVRPWEVCTVLCLKIQFLHLRNLRTGYK